MYIKKFNYNENDLIVGGVYYDSSDVFSINKNATITTEEFGNQKVIVIDDYYVNPDLVRNISLHSISSKQQNLSYPGFRSSIVLNQEKNVEFFTDLVNQHYTDTSLYDDTLNTINFNMTKSSNIYNWNYDDHGRACHPHMDTAYTVKYGAVVFLNTEDEFEVGVNGTAFYKHKHTGISDCTDKIKRFYNKAGYKNINEIFYQDNTSHCTDWINDGNEHWEIIHLSHMKYNRLVLYPSSYFHQGYYNNNDFNDTNPATDHRIVQAMFLRGLN